MFDNLRESADSSFYEEESNDLYKEAATPAYKPASMPKRRSSGSSKFLGMTAQQRFILSFMFMLTICIMGTVAMFLLGRMSF